MGEGLTPYADPTAFLYRLPAAPPGAEVAGSQGREPDVTAFNRDDVVTVDIIAFTQGRKPDLNLDLRGGDVLYVRRTNPSLLRSRRCEPAQPVQN